MANCNCISEINGKLKEYGAECLTNMFGPPEATIATYVEKKIRGKKVPHVIASYCPFCGIKYERKADVKAEAHSNA